MRLALSTLLYTKYKVEVVIIALAHFTCLDVYILFWKQWKCFSNQSSAKLNCNPSKTIFSPLKVFPTKWYSRGIQETWEIINYQSLTNYCDKLMTDKNKNRRMKGYFISMPIFHDTIQSMSLRKLYPSFLCVSKYLSD